MDGKMEELNALDASKCSDSRNNNQMEKNTPEMNIKLNSDVQTMAQARSPL